jgi:oligoendopeptidase F
MRYLLDTNLYAMSEIKQLPARSEVNPADTWDLSSLFPSDDAWEAAFTAWEGRIAEYAAFKGKLGESPQSLAACLQLDLDLDRAAERISNYAFLKTAEDVGESKYQRMQGRYMNVASRAAQAASFIRPEILAIPAATMDVFLESPVLAPYQLILQRVLRYKPHTLGGKEENLLAMQTEMAQAASQIFRQLTDADLRFGNITDHEGQVVELSHASFSALLYSPERAVRKEAFQQYYREYADHSHSLAASLAGSVQGDIYYARARNHSSALEAALFPDQVPATVYDNLIASVHKHLPALYRYYDVRRRKMGLDDIHHYDTYVPILSDLRRRHTWDEAVDVVFRSLEPLGGEYCGALKKGLCGRWCDRYENRNKQSGAFSSGTFDGDPYILMNFQPDVLDHVFTLAHEAGHSMHSWHSARRQPFAYYNYVIFVAEVASTFNEQLLSRYLLEHAASDKERAFLINRQLDAMRATIFRQTMFAEFEKLAHQSVEAGEPLTLERFREIYGGLLRLYFGPDFVIDGELSLECLRIPHFYRAFYVYKYATGMSAAISLAERVTSGGQRELDDYLNFLRGGCSKDPLDLLRDAGVDMEQPAAVDGALKQFGEMVNELDALI